MHLVGGDLGVNENGFSMHRVGFLTDDDLMRAVRGIRGSRGRAGRR